MSVDFFVNFLDLVDKKVNDLHHQDGDKFTSRTTPTGFELNVLDAVKLVLIEQKIDADIDYTEGGHAFPDIVVRFSEGKILGIEVKSSTQAKSRNDNWEILGNSILGSTRVLVDDLYVYFIRVNRNGMFTKFNRYEDSVADVVVTHSPRYKMDLSLAPGKSFFCRSGIAYSEIKNSSNPIGLITDYFRNQGETAWWISESVPATIKLWDEISVNLKDEIIAKSFILFPEVFERNNSKKYKRLAKWLVLKYSIVNISMRDTFSAGGRVKIDFKNKFYSWPRFIRNLEEYSDLIKMNFETIDDNDLITYWKISQSELNELNNLHKKIAYWLKLVCNHINEYEDHNNIEEYIRSIF